ncbi:bifunctional riboflavin kinase/FAD synthetase [Crassaminicella profunda]|uniref:bifunctional riboflavin kinase/FAD synthetase n=1 Tax=Crassaminicella profunda TaxID=1286698 RepID=UPI001CA61525|nr:bifunctional riboflavin kinase/FAD synthetase [Crassaminicella profunda]QZY56799.1 bifunctional riboflavin kinase/FAD synthetase [Crassaminicella profunda]
MEIITSLNHIEIDGNTGVALGNFDGVHIGHQTLIIKLVEACKKKGLKSVVYTFKNHPRTLTSRNGAPKKIISFEKKIRLLGRLGVDYMVCVDFDDYQRSLSPEKFVKEILKDQLKMSYGVVGFNYHFGYKAQGNTELLYELKEKYDYELMIVKAIKIQDEVVSSTKIREIIKEGNIPKVNLFLGRNYSISGKVVHGNGIGKELLGFPTANIDISKNHILPSSGVYFTKCIVDNKIYNSITNIGYKPTIGSETISVEPHILNFTGNLYNQEIKIIFYQKSRDEVKFNNTQELIQQIHKDVEKAKKFFNI